MSHMGMYLQPGNAIGLSCAAVLNPVKMGIVLTESDNGPRTVAFIIAGVSAFTAVFVWLLWRSWKSVERAERDPNYLRRRLVLFGMIYVFAIALGIEEVARGKEPIQSLAGLPVAVLLRGFSSVRPAE